MINKTAIIGMGALGLLYGDQITKTLGMDSVTYIVNEERLERYKNSKYTINGREVKFNLMDADKAKPFDLVIVAVKYSALNEAIKEMKNCVDEHTIIISVLNGINSEKLIADVYGMNHIVYAVAQGMDAMRDGSKLTFTKPGHLHIGEAEETNKENFEALVEFFTRANVGHIVEEDIMYRLWCKFMLNVGVNQVSTAFETTYAGCLTEGSEAFKIMVEAMEEVERLSNAEGVKLTDADIQYCINLEKTLKPDAYPSMRQDAVAKRPSEVDMFAGVVMEMSKKYGLKTPANEFLYKKIKSLESTY